MKREEYKLNEEQYRLRLILKVLTLNEHHRLFIHLPQHCNDPGCYSFESFRSAKMQPTTLYCKLPFRVWLRQYQFIYKF